MHIGAMLKAHGDTVKFFDLAVDAIERLDEALADADLVCISSSTVLFDRACLVLNRIKKKRSGLPVIIGGPHATLLTEDALMRGFDAAAIGEGEYTAVDLVEAIQQGAPLYDVAGAAAKQGDDVSY